MPSSHWREVLSRKAIQEGFFKQLERKKMPKASVTSFWRDMVSKYSNLSRLSPLARLPSPDRQAASTNTYRGTIAIAGKASALLASSATAEDTQRASGSRTVTSTSAVVQCPTDRRHKSPETAQLGKRKRSVSPRPQRSARSDPETNLKTSDVSPRQIDKPAAAMPSEVLRAAKQTAGMTRTFTSLTHADTQSRQW